MSDKANNKKHKNDKVLMPYFTKTLTYFLIGLLVTMPIAFGGLYAAVRVVHKAQPHFAKTQYEVQLNDSDYAPGDAVSGTVSLPPLATGTKVGTLVCSDKGLNTDVYFGANRVSYRSGAGVSAKSALPGQGKTVEVKGYAGSGLKALENLEESDMITFTTSWGTYQYEVIAAETATKPSVTEEGELLVLSCARSKQAFATFSDERLLVTARYISGPTAEEVAQ